MVYKDPVTSHTCGSKHTQTDSDCCWCDCHKKHEQSAEKEAFELLIQEEPPNIYWKELAEQRRESLHETLEENEQLHRSLIELKEENRRLSEVAEQGEKLAAFLQEVADEDCETAEEQQEEKEVKDAKSENQ